MQFNPEELGEHATDLRYAPNKLYGDEIEAASGTIYRADSSGEWLSHGEIEDLIQHSEDLEILLVDHSAAYPPGIYRVRGDKMKSWTRRLSRLYLTDDGEADAGIGWGLMAHRWVADDREALVFSVSC
ncbi:hypothetical protein OG558_15715 [Kribbella sp. NBC_01510]|uniref:hypothetical protein n=1 Tax=Kribbella sp. NBC_01510 TaxID=2903581 RepID=UPI003869D9A0